MNLAEGPWVWNPQHPFLSRIVLKLDHNDQPEIHEERRHGVLDHATGEETITPTSFVISYGHDVLQVFAERFLMDAEWFKPRLPSPSWVAEYVKARPKTIEDLINHCGGGLEDWLNGLIENEVDERGWDDSVAVRMIAELSTYDKVLWFTGHGTPLWRLWDEWIESQQP